jgi:extradiol dioxygenase family protein
VVCPGRSGPAVESVDPGGDGNSSARVTRPEFAGPVPRASTLLGPVAPILHLSLPVRDLAESRAFYSQVLGCRIGRENRAFVDVWFHGLQLTLHARPEEVVPAAEQGARHFGVTLERAELDTLVARLDARGTEWIEPLHSDHRDSPREQTKAKLADPSGNVIEIKSYADPTAAFGLDPRA